MNCLKEKEKIILRLLIDLNKIKNCLKQVSEISEKGSKKITLTDLKKEINL
tara:strand:- start:76 stop:228 length:153 start_codon:yes stop_codon:yes gene_type:complete